jgi:hypothetical protein
MILASSKLLRVKIPIACLQVFVIAWNSLARACARAGLGAWLKQPLRRFGSGAGLLPGAHRANERGQFQKMGNHESGLRGVSETSSDMRDLLERETQDVRAAEAVAVFCYQAKKWIGAFAAALGGLECEECAAGFVGHRPRQGAGHPHRRGAHDREVRRPPARIRHAPSAGGMSSFRVSLRRP